MHFAFVFAFAFAFPCIWAFVCFYVLQSRFLLLRFCVFLAYAGPRLPSLMCFLALCSLLVLIHVALCSLLVLIHVALCSLSVLIQVADTIVNYEVCPMCALLMNFTLFSSQWCPRALCLLLSVLTSLCPLFGYEGLLQSLQAAAKAVEIVAMFRTLVLSCLFHLSPFCRYESLLQGLQAAARAVETVAVIPPDAVQRGDPSDPPFLD
jgi:hypothetical protein